MDALHTSALACSAVAACCVSTGPRPERRRRLAASVLMTTAMLDTAVLHAVAPIGWATVLIAFALGSSIAGRMRSGRSAGSVYTPTGLIVMAALTMAIPHMGGSGDAAVAHGAHTTQASAVLPVSAVVLATTYVAGSLQLARRGSLSHRAHHLAMGASTALMGLALLI